MEGDRASFRRAQVSRAEPKLEAEEDMAASASRYAFAEDKRSEYAVWEASRSALVRTECGG